MKRLFLLLGLFTPTLLLHAQFPEFSASQVIAQINDDGVTQIFRADLDSDGLAEVVMRRAVSGNLVSIAYTDGEGFSEEQVLIANFPAWFDLVTGDVNNDGTQDLVLRSAEDSHFYVYLNLGEEGFSDAIDLGGGLALDTDLELADLDADGDLDIAAEAEVPTGWPTLRVLFNDGDGTTYSNQTLSSGQNLHFLNVGDADADGDLDMVTARFGDVWYLENTGDGNFAAPNVILTDSSPIYCLELLDLDGDADLDIFAARQQFGADTYWYENTPEETWTPHFVALYPTLFHASRLADLDGDGDMDLVAAAPDNGIELQLLVNKGPDELLSPLFPVSSDLTGVLQDLEMIVDDFTGDGLPEVVHADGFVRMFTNVTGQGCMDESSCNFDPEATQEGPCYDACFCTSTQAENYDWGPNNAACLFEARGVVKHDLNGNGNDNTPDIPVVGYPVNMWPSGKTVFTDDAGEFRIIDGHTSIGFSTTTNLVFNEKTTNDFGYDSDFIGVHNDHFFGLFADSAMSPLELGIYPIGAQPCDGYGDYAITLRNAGNTVVSGTVTLQYDTLFQGHMIMTPIAEEAPYTLTYNTEELRPGASQVFHVRLLHPSVDALGAPYVLSATATAAPEEGPTASVDYQYEGHLTCNSAMLSKHAYPLGFGDDHRLLPGTSQDFVLHFQNTTGATVEYLEIRDTLSVHWDLESLEFLTTSHSAQIILDPSTREVIWQFDEIQLPSSDCCESDSHGLVAYQVRSLPDTPAETRIENTAYFAFDAGAFEASNTAYTTIHYCQESLEVSTSIDVYCLDFEVLGSTDYALSEDWEVTGLWNYAGNEVGTGIELIWSPVAPVDGTLQVALVDPLCSYDAEIPVVFDPGTLGESCPTDLNCDGVTGTADLVTFLGAYPCTGAACPFDLDGDNSTGVEDMLEIIGAMGVDCP